VAEAQARLSDAVKLLDSPGSTPTKAAKSSSASRAAPPPALAEGATVELHGLTATVLNGQRGTLVRYDAGNGRWQVDLPGVGLKAIKPGNFLCVDAASAGPAELPRPTQTCAEQLGLPPDAVSPEKRAPPTPEPHQIALARARSLVKCAAKEAGAATFEPPRSRGASVATAAPTEAQVEAWLKEHSLDETCRWLAQGALEMPCPSFWSVHESKGERYYWNDRENRASWEHPLALFFRELTERLRFDPYLNIENGYLHAELKRLRLELVTSGQEWTGPFAVGDEGSEEYWYNTACNASSWVRPLQSMIKQVQILERLATELGQTDDASPPIPAGRRLRRKHRTPHGSSDVGACEGVRHARPRRSRKQVGSPASPDTPETSDTQTTAPQTPETLESETSPLLG